MAIYRLIDGILVDVDYSDGRLIDGIYVEGQAAGGGGSSQNLAIDSISSAVTLHTPSVNSTYSLALDSIASAGTVHDVEVGQPPHFAGMALTNPLQEGQSVGGGTFFATFSSPDPSGYPITGDGNELDLIPGLAAGRLILGIPYQSGTVNSDGSGLYDVQYYADNQFGRTYSDIEQVRVNDVVAIDHVAATSTLHTPSVDHDTGAQAISADAIGSSLSLHALDVGTTYSVQVDHISASVSFHNIDIGKPPRLIGDSTLSPRNEGDTVLWYQNYATYGNATQDDNPTSVGYSGDTIPGFVFNVLAGVTPSYSGAIDYNSAGSYTVQFWADNQFGRTYSTEHTLVIKNSIPLDHIVSTLSIHAPTVDHDTSAQNLPVDHIASSVSIHQAVLSGEGVSIIDHISPTVTFHEATVAPGQVSRTVGHIDAAPAIYEPNVGNFYGLSLDSIAPGTQVFDPQIVPGSATLDVDAVPSGTTVHDVSVRGVDRRVIDHIDVSETLHEPDFGVYYEIPTDHIDAAASMHEPYFGGGVAMFIDTIAAGTSVHDPRVVGVPLGFTQVYTTHEFEFTVRTGLNMTGNVRTKLDIG